MVGFRHDQREFVTTDAGSQIGPTAGGLPKQAGNRAQNGIPNGVSMPVVVGLEVIDIGHDQSQWVVGSNAADPFLF